MHHYGRLKAVCLGTPADGGGWTIWKGSLCDNDAYCMSKCVWTPECICADEKRKINKNKGSPLLIQQARENICEIWYMKSTCKSLLGGSFYVCIDQSLFTPIDADFAERTLLCVLHRDLTLSASRFAALFSSSKPSFSWKCDSITVTCHFPFISTDDKAFTFSILLHTWVYFSTDLFCYWKINVHFIQ